MEPDLDRKRIQILHELLPEARRIGLLLVPTDPTELWRRETYEAFAPSFGLQPIFVEVTQAGDLENAVAEAARRGSQVLHISPQPLLAADENFPRILRAAQKHSLPIMFDNRGVAPSSSHSLVSSLLPLTQQRLQSRARGADSSCKE